MKKIKTSRKSVPASKNAAEKLKKIIKERDREIRALMEISRAMVSGRYIQDILNIIVAITADMTGSKICSIMLTEKNGEELKIVATQSLSEAYKKKGNVLVGMSISGRAFKNRQPISVSDVRKETGYMFKEIAEKEGLVSMLAVPMLFRDKALGVINIYTAKQHKFTEEQINLLQTVANQAAIGIENEKLNTEVTNVKDALETRKIIDRAKGYLMARFNLSENDAYKMIHKKSMDSRKTMKEVSEALIIAMEFEKQRA